MLLIFLSLSLVQSYQTEDPTNILTSLTSFTIGNTAHIRLYTTDGKGVNEFIYDQEIGWKANQYPIPAHFVASTSWVDPSGRARIRVYVIYENIISEFGFDGVSPFKTDFTAVGTAISATSWFKDGFGHIRLVVTEPDNSLTEYAWDGVKWKYRKFQAACEDHTD
jgi:hypothetical protein